MLSTLRGLRAQREARTALRDALANAFGADAELGALIKDGPLAHVAHGQLRGAAVIFKQFHTPETDTFMAELTAEHDRLRRLFPHGALHAGLAVATAPGLVALQKAPGLRLDHVLDGADPAQRDELVALAGAWLGHSLGGQRETGRFRPQFWITRLREDMGAAPLPAQTAALLDHALDHLKTLGRSLRHGPVPHGPIHADYAPHNIVWDEDSAQLWVFDIQKTTVLPLGLDLARLLVALSIQMQRQYPGCALAQGVIPADRAALLSAPGLAHSAQEMPFVDFFLAHRLIKALIDKHAHPDAGLYARALQNWIETTPCP